MVNGSDCVTCRSGYEVCRSGDVVNMSDNVVSRSVLWIVGMAVW